MDDEIDDDPFELPEFFDPPPCGPRACNLPPMLAKPGEDEIQLVMKVYDVQHDEAVKILKGKARRRKQRMASRRTTKKNIEEIEKEFN